MYRHSNWSKTGRLDRAREFAKPRSKRPHEYTREDAVRLRRKVFFTLIIFAVVYLLYFIFYSNFFKISQINIAGQAQGLNLDKTISQVNQIIAANRAWFFAGDNFFTLKTKMLEDELNQTNVLASFKADKKFPRTLNISVEERLGRLLWVSLEQYYVLEADGLISGSLAVEMISSSTLPVIYDLSNEPVIPGETRVSDKQLALIMEAWLNLKNYDLPQIELAYFKVDSSQANYVKIVTREGFEIHLNYLAGFDSQIKKLKKSLASGKIDLNNIHYINLRIENQVIYK